jgi:hypothetical protein
MWIAVSGVYLFHIWLLNRTGGGYAGNPEELLELMGDSPLPPPPAKPQLPPSGTPRIGRASTALTPSRPGPVARR